MSHSETVKRQNLNEGTVCRDNSTLGEPKVRQDEVSIIILHCHCQVIRKECKFFGLDETANFAVPYDALPEARCLTNERISALADEPELAVEGTVSNDNDPVLTIQQLDQDMNGFAL